jgi:RepB DNA-primase N-terminal domain/RepB DNA-primase C-terminal helical domain
MSSASDFKPRTLTASEYIFDLFDARENVAVVVRNRSTGRTIQRIARAETVAGAEFQTWLAHQNAAGSDVFLGMNPIQDDAANRKKTNIKSIRTLYLDLDRNGDQSLQAIRDRTDIPPPNFVLDTSPGKYQVVWKINGVSQDPAESLLRNLASEFGGDPAATDSTRVLRLPGFANRKLSEEFVVRAHHETDAVYAPGDFAIEDESLETQRDASDARERRTLAPGHKSQSEHDWAYAKRALARGDNPEEIIRKIADFRSEDKADPDYYARRTVLQAQARMAQVRQESVSSVAPEPPVADKGPDH